MAFFECTIGGSGDGSTLTVTCYSGFAGLTISITNGVDTFSDVCPSTSPYEVVFDGLTDGTWTISTVYDGDTYTKTVEINAVTQFYPVPDGATVTPTDDIQTWLHCASIFDKNYTTIAQVLSDASTLQALIASNNAADYMARSTTWASDVCADANAMTYIGANDYCADTLLNDNTWLAAICSSTYFENVLNVKVPVMTSNTTPSGQCFASSIYSSAYDAYKAFITNQPSNTLVEPRWAAAGNHTNNGYIGYDFQTPVVLKMVIIDATNNGSYTSLKNYKIQGYANGAWVDIQTGLYPQSALTQKAPVNNNVAYSKYQIYIVDSWSSSLGANFVGFYGRAGA